MPSALFFLCGCLLLAGLLLVGSGRLMRQRLYVTAALLTCGIMISLTAWSGDSAKPQLRLDLQGVSKRLDEASTRFIVGTAPAGADLVVPPFIDASSSRTTPPMGIIVVRSAAQSGSNRSEWRVDLRTVDLGDAQFTACFHDPNLRFEKSIHCDRSHFTQRLEANVPVGIRLFRVDETGTGRSYAERREISVKLVPDEQFDLPPMVEVSLAEPFAINAGRCGSGVASRLTFTGQPSLSGDFSFPQIGNNLAALPIQGHLPFDGETCQFEAAPLAVGTEAVPASAADHRGDDPRCGQPMPGADCAQIDLELRSHVDNGEADALVHLSATRVSWPVDLLTIYWTMLAFLLLWIWTGSPLQPGKEQMAAVLIVAAMFLLGVRLLAAASALNYSPTSLNFLAVRAQTMMEIVMIPLLLRAMVLDQTPMPGQAASGSSAARGYLSRLMSPVRSLLSSQSRNELLLSTAFVVLLCLGLWLAAMLSRDQSLILAGVAGGGIWAIMLARKLAMTRRPAIARLAHFIGRQAIFWTLLAGFGLLLLRVLAFLLLGVQEEIRIVGPRISVSTLMLPVLIFGTAVILWRTRNYARRWLPLPFRRSVTSPRPSNPTTTPASASVGYLRTMGRIAVPIWAFIMLVFAGAFAVRDIGFILVYLWPVAIVATAYLVGSRRRLSMTGGQSWTLPAIPLFLALVFLGFSLLLAMWTRAMGSGDLASQIMPSLLLDSNHNRLLMLFGPDAMVYSSSRSTFETLELALRLHGISDGNIFGNGYLAEGLRLGIMRPFQLSDNLPAIHLIWPFGRLGAAAFVLVMCSIPVALGSTIGPLRSARSIPALSAHLAAWVLAGTAAYMILANMALAPFTGRNIFLLAATSWTDVVESLTLFALISWPLAKDTP